MTTMFKEPQHSRKLHPERKEPPISTLGVPMPLELLYKIVDDHRQELAQDNGRDLRTLAYTCRALAAYCRPLLFQLMSLYDVYMPISPIAWPGTAMRLERFSCLLHTYPSSARLVQELQILIIKPYHRPSGWSLRKIGIDTQKSEINHWRSVFKGSYPRLTTLRLKITWGYISPLFIKHLLQALKATPVLKTLELGWKGCPLEGVLRNLPPSLKHFSLLGSEDCIIPAPRWTPPPHPIPKLESLTLTARLHPTWISSTLLSKFPPFNLERLTHLQTRIYNLSTAIWRLHSTPSNTLRCLHIYFDKLWLNNDPLNVAELHVLTHVEVITKMTGYPDYYLVRDGALGWLQRTVQSLGVVSSPGVLERLRTLTFCVLFVLEGDENPYWDQWVEPRLAFGDLNARWRYLELTNLFGFTNRIHYGHPFPRKGDKPRRLWVEGAVARSYESLWKECGCSGWNW
ncbi:hypothetical protein BKA70DRAFT_747785 [Coprinopsis sp. MPI-PUGE-AT-0042]|nr:hypothetical protein BKA70DRAFT_747785 [Coprinopsis sp. MPI-PUGE-AT-0042]